MSKPYVIIGAHEGIGGAIARRLGAQGADLILTARDAQTLGGLGGRHVSLDVTKLEQISDFLSQIDAPQGLAGCVYAVGSIPLKPLKATQDKDFLSAFEVNVLGAVRVLRGLEKMLKAGKGSVVLFSSIAVQQGFTNHSVISSAKGGIEGLARALAAEWSPDIRVNVIAPSLTDTPLATPLTSSAPMREAIEKMHPIARLGTADDMAGTAAFLLSPDSAWITGQVLHVDGGRSSLRVKG
jgi:NAD(P)-dependent dehydrogenase (short-subunit alcohol dehydrogenase family)